MIAICIAILLDPCFKNIVYSEEKVFQIFSSKRNFENMLFAIDLYKDHWM